MKHKLIYLLPLTLVCTSPAQAMQGMDMGDAHAHAHMHGQVQPSTVQGIGVVEGVNEAKGIVTLTHEPIASLGWPSMTMDFSVADKALFGKLGRGQKVQFDFTKERGRYMVQHVQPLTRK